jgi:YVTN family beta-propeller protein
MTTLLRRTLPVMAAVSMLPALHAAEPRDLSYRVAQHIALGAPDRWDYVSVDSDAQRAYVAHGDRLTVVDLREGRVAGQVEGFAGGTHGSAVDPASGRGFTDDGEGGVIGVFDLKSLKVTHRLKGVADADGIVRDPVSGRIFVINGDSGSVSVVDPAKPSVSATVQVGGKLEFAAVDGAGKLYVNGASAKELVRIDTRSLAVDARWGIASCTSPHGLAVDSSAHRAFVSCVNNLLVVVDTHTGALIASLPIGAGSDAVVYDPLRHRIVSSNGRSATLSVILQKDPDTYVALADVPTVASARTLGMDPKTGRLYVAAAQVQPPAPGAAAGRPKIVPGTLELLVLEPVE